MTANPATMPEAFSALRRQAGLGFGDLHRLLCLLVAGGGGALRDLIEEAGVPHRQVLDAVGQLGIELVDQQVAITESQRDELRSLLGRDGAAEPAAEGGLLAVIEEVAAGLSPSVWDLDHVPATPATILARARYLATSYELGGAHLLCLGDHDLTAVATKLVAPQVAVSVVDVDERLLEYLEEVSDRLNLDLRLFSADLRISLPRTLRQTADLVFTDPPYSQEGIGLFVRRGVEALNERLGSSLLFCYGAGDRGAERVLGVQEMLAALRLSLDALLPGFNHYRGAHAIGARSALWVCRPTRRTRPAVVGAEARAGGTRIYSRGKASVESAQPSIPPEVMRAVRAEAKGSLGLVGQGWGEDGWEATATSVVGLRLRSLFEAATELPGAGTPVWPDLLAVNLEHYGPAPLVRVLMAAPSQCRVLVVADGRALAGAQEGPLRRLVEARHRIALLRQPQGPAPGLLSATPVQPDPADSVRWLLRYLLEHQAARLRNAWREALCALASRQGRTCTKNEARSLVEATPLRSWELDAHLLDLPSHRLAALVAAVEAMAGPPARIGTL